MNKNISIIGAPSDYGQQRRGVDMGPSAIRYAGVVKRLENLGYDIQDEGDIIVKKTFTSLNLDKRLKNLQEVIEVSRDLCEKVKVIVNEGIFPLVLGGDHSVSIGTLAGLASKYKSLGVIWFDAHADINIPETSPSGNIHGMPVAISLGLGEENLVQIGGIAPKIMPENLIIIGARSVDEGEKELIRKLGIKVYSMHEIDRMGMSKVMDEVITYLRARRVDGVHLSLDLDAIDPLYTPGVGTAVAGGITYRESHLAMEMLEEANLITSAEFVEVNPILDERNKTADVAVALMGSLFGEKLV